MNKKFVNLPSKYRGFLNTFMKHLTKDDITNIAAEKIDYNRLCSIYNNVTKLMKEYDCTSYDINKMIRSYSKNNKESNKIALFKKIASLRNKYIVYNGTKTKLWGKNISALKKKYKMTNRNNKVKNIDVEDAFIDLLTKYKYDWNGLWSIFDVSSKGVVNDINIFDVEDFRHITNYLDTNSQTNKK